MTECEYADGQQGQHGVGKAARSCSGGVAAGWRCCKAPAARPICEEISALGLVMSKFAKSIRPTGA